MTNEEIDKLLNEKLTQIKQDVQDGAPPTLGLCTSLYVKSEYISDEVYELLDNRMAELMATWPERGATSAFPVAMVNGEWEYHNIDKSLFYSEEHEYGRKRLRLLDWLIEQTAVPESGTAEKEREDG